MKTTENKRTEKVLATAKRFTARVILHDENNQAVTRKIVSETKTTYRLDDDTIIKKAEFDTVKNVSKNQYNVHDDKKKYLSHSELFNDIQDLENYLKTLYVDACSTQYYAFCLNRSAKLRIQKNCIEILASCLENYENSQQSTKMSENSKRYAYTVQATTKEEIEKCLQFIEECIKQAQ